MKNIIDRLEEYMIFKKLNNNNVTNQCSLSNGLIGIARKARKGLHSDSIEKILLRYNDLNPDWLLTGRGKMLTKEDSKEQIETRLSASIELLQLIREKDEKTLSQAEELWKLKQELSVLKKNHKDTSNVHRQS